MKKIILTIVSLFLFSQSVLANYATESARCAEFNDSLDTQQANNRSLWAAKCYPWLKFTMQEGKVYLKNSQTGELLIGYPLFGSLQPDGSVIPKPAPIDPAADCWDPNTHPFLGYCRAGCFTPDQEILFNTPVGYKEIALASQKGISDILIVDGVDTNNEINLRSRDLVSYTVDPKAHNQPILIFQTVDGEIQVTPNHPLVDGRGYMVAASTLKVGDSLKTVTNTNSKITSIEKVDYFGKVYNIDMGTSDMFENIIVANDFLSGTVYYQNDGISNLNRQVLRTLIPKEILK